MVRKPARESNAAARRRVTAEMLRIGTTIDAQTQGTPKRLELLRRQARLSDELEALRSVHA